jgi:hypothetical protein
MYSRSINNIQCTRVCKVSHFMENGRQPETLISGITSPVFKLFENWCKLINKLPKLCVYNSLRNDLLESMDRTRELSDTISIINCPVASTRVFAKINPLYMNELIEENILIILPRLLFSISSFPYLLYCLINWKCKCFQTLLSMLKELLSSWI